MGAPRLTLTPTTRNPLVGDLYLDESGSLMWLSDDPTASSAATFGYVYATCNLNGAVTLPVGRTISDGGNSRWTLRDAFTSPAGPAADYVLQFRCERAGRVLGLAGTLTTIVTAIAGWNSVTNAADAEPGENALAEGESYALMVLQRIRCRLLFIRREWYLDMRQGTPWRERLWRKGVTVETVRRVVEEVVLSTPGVQSLHSLAIAIDRATRTATITLVAIAETGDIITTDLLDAPMLISVPPLSEGS